MSLYNDLVAHKYMTNLMVISKIPERGQLTIRGNDIDIYDGGVINWVLRKFYGDGKEKTVKFLQEFYREIRNFTEQLMITIIAEKNTVKHNRLLKLLSCLAEKIKESLTGLNNLSKTYIEYHKINASITCLVENTIMQCYKEIVDFLPPDYTESEPLFAKNAIYCDPLHHVEPQKSAAEAENDDTLP